MSNEMEHRPSELRMIPLDRIEVLNPRERNSRVFDQIVGNIQSIGLKKPIIVTPRSPLELLVGIEQLRDQGYDKKAIAEKTGLSPEYVQGILYLLKNGEERLLMAVGSGRIPLNAAITIAGAGTDDKSVQAALQEAYESGKLRGSQLIQARRVIERRRTQGRSTRGRMLSRKLNEDVTTSSLVRNYQREVERQKLLVRKAETAQRNLLFIAGALRQLLADENFTNLLRAEGLDTLPQYLADRVWTRGSGA
jgi:ParB family chromosome partitioning protein